MALLVGGREEEHVHRLDERAVGVVKARCSLDVVEPVGQRPRAEAVLQLARSRVVAHADDPTPR